MELCTIDSSEEQIEALDVTPLDDAPIVPPADEFNPPEPAPEVVEEPSDFTTDFITDEDDLEVQEEPLNAAARDSRLTRPDPTPERVSWITAFGSAVLIHAGFVALCLAFATTILLPRVSFTQGSGSSESGLVAENSRQTASLESSVLGPILTQDQPQKMTAIEGRALAQMQVAQETPPVQLPVVKIIDPDDREDDSAIIGAATDPIGPPPVRHHPSPPPSPKSAAQVAATSGASAPPGAMAAVKHTFVMPRGAGHPGIGAEGSGFDSRGLPVPEYPPESRRRHEEGIVELDVLVRPDGTVGSATVVKDSGYPRLDHAAVASIESARFFPGRMDGVPIALRIRVPYHFILQ